MNNDDNNNNENFPIFASMEEFDDPFEYEAYVLTCLLCNLLPDLVPESVCEVVLACLAEHKGLDPEIAANLGAALRGVALTNAETIPDDGIYH